MNSRSVKFGAESPHWQGGQVKCVCLTCSKEFFVDKHVIKKGYGKFCSRTCTGKRKYGKKRKVPRVPMICAVCKKVVLHRYTDIKRERNRGRCCSKKCRVIYTQKSISGEKNYRWLGGKTPINALERSRMSTRNWSRAVKVRDNFTCQDCGIHSYKGLGYAVVLHSHHIKPWAKFPKLRYVLSNGITYCDDCHKKHRKDCWSACAIRAMLIR